MSFNIFSCIAETLTDYVALTIGEPCRTISEQCQAKVAETKCKEKSNFSFFGLVMKQRALVSPKHTHQEVDCHNLNRRYVQETYRSPSRSSLLH